ncbi:MAG TPA: hypothetical protein DEF51_54265 [Myxococcales bacterium]|nr:hypothetical protein [Myxococcales bacterium]
MVLLRNTQAGAEAVPRWSIVARVLETVAQYESELALEASLSARLERSLSVSRRPGNELKWIV